jgi:hypothetical protein
MSNKVLVKLEIETDVETASTILDFISEKLNKRQQMEQRTYEGIGSDVSPTTFNMSKSNKGPRY